MRSHGLTLIEVLLGGIIVALLITVAFPTYRLNIMEDAKARVCESHLRTLKTGLDIYAAENDVMPGDLSQLPSSYINRAYAQLMNGRGAWRFKLAAALVRWDRRNTALASVDKSPAGLMHVISRGDIELLTCPSDSTPPDQGGISYGLREGIKGITSAAYRDLPRDAVVIADCDGATFEQRGQLAMRHEHYALGAVKNFANAITRDGSSQPQVSHPVAKTTSTVQKMRVSGFVEQQPPSHEKTQ
jgi:hypothetical protein